MLPFPLTLFALSSLAEIAPPIALTDGQIQLAILLMLGVLIVGFFQVLTSVIGLIKFFRSDPPIHTVYATKEELKEIDARTQREILKVEQRMESQGKHLEEIAAEIFDEIRSLHRALGVTEGELKAARDQVKAAKCPVPPGL